MPRGDKDRESADVKAIAEAKLLEIDRKIAELVGLRGLLHHLVEHCQEMTGRTVQSSTNWQDQAMAQ